MRVKLFVGNLPWSVGDPDLEQLFGKHGQVESARVIVDRDTGRSRGFGFVEIDGDPKTIIDATNGQEIEGRPMRVNEAEEKESNRSFGGGRSSGGSRGGSSRGGPRGGGSRGGY